MQRGRRGQRWLPRRDGGSCGPGRWGRGSRAVELAPGGKRGGDGAVAGGRGRRGLAAGGRRLGRGRLAAQGAADDAAGGRGWRSRQPGAGGGGGEEGGGWCRGARALLLGGREQIWAHSKCAQI
ncbi:hypothetical protein GUJ93_ZPchr0001g32957 [Zizania palustris]|uniref:Uncharacterized protein n=1 Tax=Zizania palustris TaxID=103762 RepID=A0A8J5RS72_ZIZPA|nr:hypothetical protein GUJ93_ZPchr0001g32957 [Zizania palustris]